MDGWIEAINYIPFDICIILILRSLALFSKFHQGASLIMNDN